MSKIILLVLAVAAFFCAVWLVLTHRQLPEPKQARGLRRRFILATLLFVGLLVTTSSGQEAGPSETCYDIVLPEKVRLPITEHKLGVTVKAVWRTLDPTRAEEFRNKLQEAVGQSVIRKKTANMLAIAFAELAYHKNRTRGDGPRMSCYEMTQLGGMLQNTRENALKQLELLEKARKSGTIDEKTAKKAHAVLAREVQMLYQAKGLNWPQDYMAQEKLIEEYKADKIIPGDSVSVAAGIIVEMEEGQLPELTPAKRLATMKERIEKLFTDRKGYTFGGPFGNDWVDPGIQPNMFEILQTAGLITQRPGVKCYSRAALPVKARSEELKNLQKQLLDEKVKAGVLDVEVAERAAVATTKESDIDYATERDIRQYQKKVRRIMRLLYKHGELPSSFVRRIEKAVDIEIISFNPAKVLRNDMRWHFRSMWGIADEVLKPLEARKLIPPARNHRLAKKWVMKTKISDKLRRRLTEFEALIDGNEAIELQGDERKKIKLWHIPKTETGYRLKIRRVCRALIKTGFVDQKGFGPIEDVIGIPVIGIIEKK